MGKSIGSRLRDVAVYYHFAISTFPVKIVIWSSAFILEYLLHLPISPATLVAAGVPCIANKSIVYSKALVGLAVGADELSPTLNLRPRAIHNLFRGGNVTSETPALQSVKGRSKGGDGVGNGIGKSGGVLDGGISDDSIPDQGDGSGSGWEVDGDSALNQIIAAVGGDGNYGSGDEYDVSGDGCRVDMARNMSTFAVDRN
ncbi:hypothetical protein Tco_0509392 [Tanacetum coccineum]